MKLARVIEHLSLEVFTSSANIDQEVTGGYCGDLLSHVLSSAAPGNLWITIQHHTNVVAVAQVAELAAVLLADGKQPNEAMLERASAGRIVLLGSSNSAFEISGRLRQLLTG